MCHSECLQTPERERARDNLEGVPATPQEMVAESELNTEKVRNKIHSSLPSCQPTSINLWKSILLRIMDSNVFTSTERTRVRERTRGREKEVKKEHVPISSLISENITDNACCSSAKKRKDDQIASKRKRFEE